MMQLRGIQTRAKAINGKNRVADNQWRKSNACAAGVMVIIEACHALDPGSIPGRRIFLSFSGSHGVASIRQ